MTNSVPAAELSEQVQPIIEPDQAIVDGGANIGANGLSQDNMPTGYNAIVVASRLRKSGVIRAIAELGDAEGCLRSNRIADLLRQKTGQSESDLNNDLTYLEKTGAIVVLRDGKLRVGFIIDHAGVERLISQKKLVALELVTDTEKEQIKPEEASGSSIMSPSSDQEPDSPVKTSVELVKPEVTDVDIPEDDGYEDSEDDLTGMSGVTDRMLDDLLDGLRKRRRVADKPKEPKEDVEDLGLYREMMFRFQTNIRPVSLHFIVEKFVTLDDTSKILLAIGNSFTFFEKNNSPTVQMEYITRTLNKGKPKAEHLTIEQVREIVQAELELGHMSLNEISGLMELTETSLDILGPILPSPPAQFESPGLAKELADIEKKERNKAKRLGQRVLETGYADFKRF